MTSWTPSHLPDLSGTRVVVTGVSSGLGLAAARHLAARGAGVIGGARDLDKARRAVDFEVDLRALDLADLASVHSFASAIDSDVDVLINNAGVMAVPLGRTAQGFELQFGTNHLGHFALTGLLLDRIRSRVVTVSSSAHRPGRIRFDDPNWNSGYQRWAAYSQSKLANLLFTSELQRRLAAAGSSVRAVAAHPGYAATGLQSRTANALQDGFMRFANRVIAQSAEQGSWPLLFAAVADIPGDSFVGPDGPGETRGHPTLVGRSDRAKDAEAGRRLWDLSEELTGVHYTLRTR